MSRFCQIFLNLRSRLLNKMNNSLFSLKDKQTFKSFFEDFYSSLCLFANKYLKDKDMSRDIVQDAFLYLWIKRADFSSPNLAKSYLYKYVKDRSLNYLRDKGTRQKIELKRLESEVFFRDNLIEEETYLIIFNAIKKLSPQSQRVIELSLDGLKNQEIAEALSISINTVKTIKLRAFASLRDGLKDNVFVLFVLHCSSWRFDV